MRRAHSRAAADAQRAALDHVVARPRAPPRRGRAQLVPAAIAGEDAPPIYYSDEDRDGDFAVDGADPEEAFATWQRECGAADAIAAAHSLDDVDTRPGEEGDSLRWILVHMIEEYSRHNGHADLLRERIDGATGE